jgi:hypothetical protein
MQPDHPNRMHHFVPFGNRVSQLTLPPAIKRERAQRKPGVTPQQTAGKTQASHNKTAKKPKTNQKNLNKARNQARKRVGRA